MEMKSQGQLQKSFGLGMAIILVMSNIIGSGVFKKVVPMSEQLLSPGLVMLAWVLAGFVTIFGVLTVAEAATMFPESGGPYVWLRKMYGRMFSFLYGWSCFTVIQSAAIASIAFVFAGALGYFVNLPHLSAEWEGWGIEGVIAPFDNIGAKLVSIALIWALTIVNYRGAKHGGAISQIFTYTVVAGILIIVVLGLTSSVGNWSNLSTPSAAYSTSELGQFSVLAGVMLLAMRNAFWAYEGWVSLGFVGEEIKDPQRNFPRALILGILGVIAVYLLANITYLYVMPVDELIAGAQANENSIAAVMVMKKVMGENAGLLISGLILVSTFGCTNTTILTASRIYYSMAREGEFFKGAENCHPVYNTPTNALIYQAIWASVLVLSGSFDTLTDLLIFAAFIFYGAMAFGVMWLRYKSPDAERSYKTIGYPFVPAIFVLFCAVLVVYSIIENPTFAGIGLALILSGLPFYYFWKK